MPSSDTSAGGPIGCCSAAISDGAAGCALSAAVARWRLGLGSAGVPVSLVFDRGEAGRLAISVSPLSKILPIGPDEFVNTGEGHAHPVGPVVELVPELAQRLVQPERREQRRARALPARQQVLALGDGDITLQERVGRPVLPGLGPGLERPVVRSGV